MESIIEKAFEYPAAVLIGDDAGHFADPQHIGYEIGIQGPRTAKRFANFFRYGDKFAMYFKHDVNAVDTLYANYPDVVLPSEIATKYWSKLSVEREPDLAAELLAESYRLVLETVTKKGQKIVDEIAQTPNRFLTFHNAALELAKREDVYLKYNDFENPHLSVGIHRVVEFSFNQLRLRSQDSSWSELGPESYQRWPQAMSAAIDQWVT